MDRTYQVDIKGFKADLPVLPLPNGISICFFNLHGDSEMTEHCGKELAKLLTGCDVVITAESKGLQLSHVIARELGQRYYAVCRKSKKLYMQDGIQTSVKSITTGNEQTLYVDNFLGGMDLSGLPVDVYAIVDDVVSTGGSLRGLEQIVNLAGGIIYKKAFVLAEGDAAERDDIVYLAKIPIITD